MKGEIPLWHRLATVDPISYRSIEAPSIVIARNVALYIGVIKTYVTISGQNSKYFII